MHRAPLCDQLTTDYGACPWHIPANTVSLRAPTRRLSRTAAWNFYKPLPCRQDLPTEDSRSWPTVLPANQSHWRTGAQPRLQSGGSVPWFMVLLLFYRKKLDRSIQFGAVGYIIALYSSKSYVKSWRSVQFGGGGPDSQCLRPCWRMIDPRVLAVSEDLRGHSSCVG